MNERSFFRFGAGSLMVGAVLGLVFNLIHPRPSEGLIDVKAELKSVADSDIWYLDHVALAIAVGLTSIGLVAVGRSLLQRVDSSWTWLFLFSLAISTAVIFLLLAIDTWPLKEAADSGEAAVGDTLVHVISGLIIATTGSHFGVTSLLLGTALLATPLYPKNLAYLFLVSGAIGFVGSIYMAFAGPDSLGLNGFFTVSSLGLTVGGFWAGWFLWKSSNTTMAGTPVG